MDRNADAPTQMEDGSLVFAKPHEEDQDFEEFLNYVINQEKNPSSQGSEIRYAQTRNVFPFPHARSRRMQYLTYTYISSRKQQPPRRIFPPSPPPPHNHPLRSHRPRPCPRRPKPLDRQLPLRHRHAPRRLREPVRPDPRAEALCPHAGTVRPRCAGA